MLRKLIAKYRHWRAPKCMTCRSTNVIVRSHYGGQVQWCIDCNGGKPW